ncbi:MAG: hypothetical protein ACMUIG_06725 [Thermoplasmatota archaeon]
MAIDGGRSRIKDILLLNVLLISLIIPTGALIATGMSDAGEDAPDITGSRRSWLDVNIESVEKVVTSQSNSVYPGQTITISVNLVHDDRPQQSTVPITVGNQNTFTVVLVIDDDHDNVSTQYKKVNNMPLLNGTTNGPNGQSNPLRVLFQWTIPPKAPEGLAWSNFQFKVTATITLDDDDKSDNFRTGPGIRVSEPEFSPYIWEVDQKEGELFGPVHPVSVGETLIIPFELHNGANQVDKVGIEYLDIPPGWIPQPFDEIPVYPSDFEEMTLALYVSPDPLLSMHREEPYEIIVRAYSAFYPEGPYEVNSIHRFLFKVKFKPGVNMEPVQQTVYLEPGKKHDVYFNLKNTGNGIDSYQLSGVLSDQAVKEKWTVTVLDKLPSNVYPGEIQPIRTRIYIPPSAPHYRNSFLLLTATSQKQYGYSAESKKCTIFADIRYDAYIEEFEDPFIVEPGKENLIKFNFTNEGNNVDPNQELKVFRAPLGWSIYIDQSPIKRGKGIGPLTTVYLDMIVVVPESATTTTTGINLHQVIIDAVGGPSSDPSKKMLLDRGYFNFSIPLRRKLSLSSPEPLREGFVGSQVEFLVNVQNKGNWFDTFNLSVDSPWAELETDKVEPTPNETWPVKLWVNIPDDAEADTKPETNRLDPYQIRVSGYSQNETKKGQTLVYLDLFIQVTPFYSFEMMVDPDEKRLQFSADHSTARTVKIKIDNTGNIEDEIRLEFPDNPYSEWLTVKTQYVTVPFEGVGFGILSFTPEEGMMEPGNYSIVLQGTSWSPRDPVDRISVSITIEIFFYRLMFEIENPRINNETIPPEGSLERKDLDRRYSLQAEIVNTGSVNLTPVQFGTLYIVLKDGFFEVDRANISYLPVGGSKTVYFAWTANQPGPHNIVFELEGGDDVRISDDSGDRITREVFVSSDEGGDPPKDTSITLLDFMPQLILLAIFGFAIFLFAYRMRKIHISPVDTGYDEDGTYRPWAVKEKLRGEDKEKLEGADKAALPPQEKEALPPAPAAAGPGPSSPLSAQVPRPAPVGARPPMPGQPQPARAQPLQMPRPAVPMPPRPGQPVPQRPGQPIPPRPGQ